MLVLENVVVKGIASSVPENVESNREQFAFNDGDIEKIIASTGVSEKRVTDYETETSDLCLHAAQCLLNELGWRADEIDALIFVSQTPDYQLPATSCVLQNKLGMRTDTLCLDISLGCSGYVHGLQVASSLVSNGLKKVILLVGDTISKLVAPSDRSTRVLFGDAGSATCLEYEAAAKTSYFVSGTDGSGSQAIMIKPNMPTPKARGVVSGNLVMDGAEVFAFTLKRIPNLVKKALEISGKEKDDIDLFVFHQANEMMLKHLLKKCHIPPEKFIVEIDGVGNTSGASIPVAICSKQTKHDIAVKYTMLVGFGVGLSWGAVVLDLSGTLILPLKIYRVAENA